MGLFSRKDNASARKPLGKPRPSVTSEAQAADLRIKARRRLAGAVVLILAAVVVLPMLLDSEPAPVASNIPIRIPDRQTPFQPNLSSPEATPTEPAGSAQASASGATTNNAQVNPLVAGQVTPGATDKPLQANTADTPKASPIAKPTTTSASTSQPSATPNVQQRRDDSARALALLEGRSPVASTPSPSAPVRGNFVVQAMSLDSSADAQKQRNVLISAGLNNAFVDGPVDVNGRAKYRVKVGPFQSREAAQAAQTRLRTQGYGGAFITTQ